MPKSKERCQEIREQMRETILQKSLLYFARNGFAGTQISDLSGISESAREQFMYNLSQKRNCSGKY